MPYNETLAERIEDIISPVPNVIKKTMFGGVAVMADDHMCEGVIDDVLMARVGPDQYETCLKKKHVSEMTFTGKPMKGMIYVNPDEISSDKD